MNKQNLCTVFCLLFGFAQLLAQNVSISGTITDAENGETIIGATVYERNSGKGTATNEYGFYSLSLPAGEVELVYSYIGYENIIKKVTLDKNETFNIKIGAAAEELQEIVVEGDSYQEQVKTTQMGMENVSMKEAKLLPALFGEVDIIKTLQLKPGVKSGGEGTSGISVRGGGTDQNLVLLDEATIYNASHLFGFFSTFNSDAVKSVNLYKAGFPAQYGGRLSSVLDVRLNDGNNQKFSGSGGLGLIASRLTLEGPIVKDKGSFIISGRRTYADLITGAINKANEGKENFNPIPDYFFYDLNAKFNYQITPNDRVYASSYFGRDVFKFISDDFDFSFKWGNIAATARWNHIFNEKMFSNTTFTFSDYKYEIDNSVDIFSFNLQSGIRDFQLLSDYYYEPKDNHSLKFGASLTYHAFDIGRLKAGSDDGEISFDAGTNLDGWQMAAYIGDKFEVSDKFELDGGVRLSGFANDNKFYANVEPRLAARYSLNKDLALKASYARMSQYLHLVAASGASLPTDIWYPSDSIVKPQTSDQVSLGLTYNLKNKYLFTLEGYYKWLNNQVDFKEGAQLFVNENLNQEFIFGDGYSYGAEMYVEKKKGKVTGWIGYTLAWSWREFQDVNGGERYSPRFDTRHDISVVALYEISKRWTVTGTWVYTSGNPISLSIGRFSVQDVQGGEANFVVPVFTDRNNYRMPAYHRLDLGVVYKFFPKWGSSDLTFSAYNTYDRRNPFFIYYDVAEEDGIPTSVVAKQVSLFPILPSITWNFKF